MNDLSKEEYIQTRLRMIGNLKIQRKSINKLIQTYRLQIKRIETGKDEKC